MCYVVRNATQTMPYSKNLQYAQQPLSLFPLDQVVTRTHARTERRWDILGCFELPMSFSALCTCRETLNGHFIIVSRRLKKADVVMMFRVDGWTDLNQRSKQLLTSTFPRPYCIIPKQLYRRRFGFATNTSVAETRSAQSATTSAANGI